MVTLSYLMEHNRYLNLVGIAVVIGIAYAFSHNRNKIRWELVGKALALQFGVAFFMLKTTIGYTIVKTISDGVSQLYGFAGHGTRFLFGNLANNIGTSWGTIFAFQVLPIIIFFGAFMALLSYLGIVQRCVAIVNYVMRPLLGTSGAETLCAISNSFLGQTEAPLLVRNYLKRMTKSEMFVVMVSGMATISGAILVVFAQMGVPTAHLLTSSVMAIPASIMMAKIIYPETKKPETLASSSIEFDNDASNVIDAISTGTSDGLQLALNVGAMLVSFIALIAFVNAVLGGATYGVNRLLGASLPSLNLSLIFSRVFWPFAYLLGFSGDEAFAVGELLGTKVTINEFVAYTDMVTKNLSDRTASIVTYALCGFSNFSCIGIQVGGIGALVPEKRAWLTELGMYTVLGSSLSNLLSALMASLLL